jgi:hypothetical protein
VSALGEAGADGERSHAGDPGLDDESA